MNRVKEHFENEAQEFDSLILRLIPGYHEMIKALVLSIPFKNAAPLKVIDLGCGTGTVARWILEAFPNAAVTCLDLAENMIAMARVNLGTYPGARFLVSDFSSFQFDETYDVAVSSLALHHLVTDDDKRGFYRRIFCALRPGGVFFNADIVLGSSEFLQSRYLEQWRAFMRRNVPKQEIESTWIPKYEAEDRPAKLVDQLAWLAEIGFTDVDVVWKYYNFAVYGGENPESPSKKLSVNGIE
jgi:tRNA (cmo5U34)-methyltransferase